MHLKLGEPYDNYIEGEIQAGFFSNATEVVRDALRRRMESKEKQRIEKIHALIAIGEDQIKNGDTVPFSPDFMDNAMKRAKENSKSGKPVSDELKPRK